MEAERTQLVTDAGPSEEEVTTNGLDRDSGGYAAKDSKWPELQGKAVKEALAFFKEKYPRMKVLILDEGCKFDRQPDYRRIVFYQDWDDIVVSVPDVG